MQLKTKPERRVQLTFEVDLAVAVSVEDVDDSLHERVLLQLGQLHELVDAQRPRVVEVELLEALSQPLDLFRIDCTQTQQEVDVSTCTDALHLRVSTLLCGILTY